MNYRVFDFIGTNEKSTWTVDSVSSITGLAVPLFKYLNVIPAGTDEGIWKISGAKSNLRYTERAERDQLQAYTINGEGGKSCAAMVLISKSDAWWELPQDERREIFEKSSRHIAIGMEYIPAISRTLYHARDLQQSFDFVTWFEFQPEAMDLFDNLINRLRETEEWQYVTREFDVRMHYTNRR